MLHKDIHVIDCSIRDGGLINKHHFDHDFVRDIYRALSQTGVDVMEFGYRNSPKKFSPDEYGPWKFTTDSNIEKVTDGIETKMKHAVMVDIGRCDLDDFKPADESPVDMVRTATYLRDIEKAVSLANHFHGLGYEATINLMAISRDAADPELEDGLIRIEEETNVTAVYIVDSFGHLHPEAVRKLIMRFRELLKTKNLGFHGHNHIQLGFANTIEAMANGVTYLDGTIYGIGRAAGNCPLELLMGFLNIPQYDIRPVLDLISKRFLNLRREIEWGYIIPYAITGLLNEHPRSAMQLRDSADKDEYRAFYDRISNAYMD